MAMEAIALHRTLDDFAKRDPDRIAIEVPASNSVITYGALAALSDRVRDRLHRWDIRTGQRVGVYQAKSIDAIASFFGILKSGATYVPADPTAPPARNAYIFDNCSVAAIVVERRFEQSLRAELTLLGRVPPMLILDEVGGGKGLTAALD